MKKYVSFGIFLCVIPSLCLGYSARYTRLLQEKQRKMEELEKCTGTTKGLKIAGISTLGLTAVGIAGNIVEAKKISDYTKESENLDTKIADARKEKKDLQGCESEAGEYWDAALQRCVFRNIYGVPCNADNKGKIYADMDLGANQLWMYKCDGTEWVEHRSIAKCAADVAVASNAIKPNVYYWSSDSRTCAYATKTTNIGNRGAFVENPCYECCPGDSWIGNTMCGQEIKTVCNQTCDSTNYGKKLACLDGDGNEFDLYKCDGENWIDIVDEVEWCPENESGFSNISTKYMWYSKYESWLFDKGATRIDEKSYWVTSPCSDCADNYVWDDTEEKCKQNDNSGNSGTNTVINLADANVEIFAAMDKDHVRWNPIGGASPSEMKNHIGQNNTKGLDKGEWELVFNYGTVKGKAYCSGIKAKTYAEMCDSESCGFDTKAVSEITATQGVYCYCYVTNYTPSDSSKTGTFKSGTAFYSDSRYFEDDVNECEETCAWRCATDSGEESSGGDCRKALFGVPKG